MNLETVSTKDILSLTTRIASLEASGHAPTDEPYIQALVELGNCAEQIGKAFANIERLTDLLGRLDGYSHFDLSGSESHEEYQNLKEAIRMYLSIGEVPEVPSAEMSEG